MLLYGATLTYMGLAALVAWLHTVSCGAATAAFFTTGIFLFLLPPVPGLAVYLTSGVLLPPACENEMGFLYACFYASVMAFLMKLVAQVLQQKLIGELLGSSISVRAAIGVNSDLIKAIRRVLESRGLTVAKVSLLCGGPDWPTAVLCGILRVSVWQMLFGLLPVYLFTLPAAFAGAAQLRDENDRIWAPLGTIATMVASLEAGVLACLALYHIERIKHNTDMSDDLIDDEVAAIERHREKAHQAFTVATAFDQMPCWPRVQLVSGTCILTLSAYLLVFFSADCFEAFALTDDVQSALCLHCERAAVKPLGWIALGMLAVALACLLAWWRWTRDAVAKRATALV